MTYYDRLIALDSEINKIGSCASILHYDMATSMPPAGSEYRGGLMEMLSITSSKMMKAKKFLKAIELAKAEPLTEDQKINVADIEDAVKFSNRIPTTLHGKLARSASECHAEWELVKSGGKDKKYLKLLDKQIGLIKKTIDLANKGEFATPYDYLLDGYSEGISSEKIKTMFEDLKPFVDSVLAKLPKTEVREFVASDEKVMIVAQKVAEQIIGNKDAFHLAKSTHPFCTTLGVDDVRITTRIKPGNILDSIGSTIHESGHATYELGLNKKFYGLALGSAASIAAHEGISLFYEKHIGESEQFAKYLAELFGESIEDVLAWMRQVDPDNIVRTESDEITYQRHIINRFTVENEIFNGDLKTKDIPARWNELYGKDLAPSVGYAIDVHWCQGSFGYFPSYTIGHMIAAQLKAKMSETIDFSVPRIEFDKVRSWLKTNYFDHGGRYDTSELVKVATGSELSTTYWKNYIMAKFGVTDA
jgi:carboxypeptidase Taq